MNLLTPQDRQQAFVEGPKASVRRLGRDSWLVSGLLRADEVADATGFDMPEGSYETLAGMVLARLGRIPDVGDDLAVDGWRLTVMRRDRNRIAEVRVARPDTRTEPTAPAPAITTREEAGRGR